MTILMGFAVAAGVTFVMRSSMTLIGAHRSSGLQTAVAAITPTVLAAMVASALFVHRGDLRLPTVAEVAALGTGFAVAHKTGNVSLALAVGLPVHAAVTFLASATLAAGF